MFWGTISEPARTAGGKETALDLPVFWRSKVDQIAMMRTSIARLFTNRGIAKISAGLLLATLSIPLCGEDSSTQPSANEPPVAARSREPSPICCRSIGRGGRGKCGQFNSQRGARTIARTSCRTSARARPGNRILAGGIARSTGGDDAAGSETQLCRTCGRPPCCTRTDRRGTRFAIGFVIADGSCRCRRASRSRPKSCAARNQHGEFAKGLRDAPEKSRSVHIQRRFPVAG